MLVRCSWILLAAGRRHDLGWIVGLVISLAIIVPLIMVLVYLSWKEKKRTAAMKNIADQLGFEFFPKGEPGDLLEGFRVFSQGRGRKLWNLMRRRSESFEVAIFDYKYITGGGKSSQTWQQSVVWFQSDGLSLPAFALRPKRIWNVIGAWFGQQSIEFETRPQFSKKYVLVGTEESAVRQLFTEPVLDFYEQNAGWSTEGSSQRLLLYNQSKRVAPHEIPALLEQGLKLLSLMSTGGQS